MEEEHTHVLVYDVLYKYFAHNSYLRLALSLSQCSQRRESSLSTDGVHFYEGS